MSDITNIRPTRMLKAEGVREDLGISVKQLNILIDLEILTPIFLGKGWKFDQASIFELQQNYRGLRISNYLEAKETVIMREKQGVRNSIES